MKRFWWMCFLIIALPLAAEETLRSPFIVLESTRPAFPPLTPAAPAIKPEEAAPARSTETLPVPIPVRPAPVEPVRVDPPPADIRPEERPREEGPQTAVLPPPPPVPAAAAGAGKTISLDLRDMDVIEVLKILSRQSNINVVVGKNVTGKVTVFLKNVEFWEALKTILETRDLAYVKDGDLVRVITDQDYIKDYGLSFSEKAETRVFPLKNVKARTAKDTLEPLKTKVGNLVVDEITNTLVIKESPETMARMEEMLKKMDVPTETRIFTISHGIVDEILAKVQPLASKEFGSLQADKRTNTLIVTDNPARVAEIERVVHAFDVKNKAVMIEAKIVQVVLGDRFQYGINWDRAFAYQRSPGNTYSGGAIFNSDAQLTPFQSIGGAPVTSAGATARPAGLTANLTALTGVQVAGALNFLQTVGQTKILSSPRIVALNNQEAKILVGSKEAYVTTTVVNPGGSVPTTTTEQVNFVEVGVKLFVTPVIGDDGFITLKVKPEVSSVESTLKTAQGNAVPIVRVSQAETSLVVKDGVTALIGGLIEDKKVDTKTGVPILSKIPILGIPFRSQDTNKQKTELVIFLTPRIATGESSSTETMEKLPEKDWPEDLPRKKGFFRRWFGGK